ncbi:MAG: TerC family protein [Rickettsiales bacterium]|nr:TerC family protein [Rickettsiales bacterium]
MDFLTYDIFFALLTLTFLEIVLGIDNLIFIAIAVQKLPKPYRKKARIFGLSLALIIRIVMLLGLSWVMGLTEPLFYIGDKGFSYKNFLLIFGGLFLIIKGGWEIAHDVLFASHHDDSINTKKEISKGMLAAIVQISLVDFVFSFDSVITAIGMTDNVPVIVIAIVISMIVMLMASESLTHFLKTYPSLKIVALAFIFMLGVILFADGIHFHISKGYLYFSLFFTMTVEILNIISRKNKHYQEVFYEKKYN